MPVNWSLGLAPDVGGMFLKGWEHGKQQAKQRKTDNALAAFAQNPDDPNTVNALMQVDPRIGLQVRQQQQQQRNQQDEMTLKRQQAWRQMNKDQQADFVDAAKFMTNGQMMISQLPEAERAAAWSEMVRVAEQEKGWDIPAGMEAYSPKAVRSLASLAGMSGDLLDINKVEWKTVGEGGLIPISATTGLRVDRPGAEPVGVEGVSSEDAPAILQNAQQSGTITRAEAMRVQQSLGKNGAGAFQQWMQKHNIRIADEQPAPPPPPGFVLD